MDTTEQFLSLLGDPNIGFILMTIAIYGIIFESSDPGSVFPGVIGGLALILAFVSFAVIAVNVAGLLFIGFSLILFVADIKGPATASSPPAGSHRSCSDRCCSPSSTRRSCASP